MRKIPVKLGSVLFFLSIGLLLFIASSGYLYHQNNTYRNENRRLIILNDSVLSENIELKNALQQKRSSSAFKSVPENLKTKEIK
jgi:hypothetical protein